MSDSFNVIDIDLASRATSLTLAGPVSCAGVITAMPASPTASRVHMVDLPIVAP